MNNTSSQDEFAKWAKLRRKHDKTLEEYEAMSMWPFPRGVWLGAEADCAFITDKSIVAEKTSFEWSVKIARWLSTNGLKIFLQFYYSKTPVFALPANWFPYYIQWILSFPRAPLGSVSIQVWSNVCATAITAMAEVITSVSLGSRIAQPVPAATSKKGQ